jgi:hypothetical protein
VRAMVALGDDSAARDLANSIFDPKPKDTALATVAEAFASGGDHRGAAPVFHRRPTGQDR